MKYYLIAGEASGDLHAANLMAALREADPEAQFRFMGGDLMTAQGGERFRHYAATAYMGFIPVLMHLPEIFSALRQCKADILRYAPDVLVLVDYPGFNLKIAAFAHRHLPTTPVCYYISPKLWAWKRYRIRQIRRCVTHMFCILPFEEAFYRSLGYGVEYVGNPSVDAVERFLEEAPSEEAFRAAHGLPEGPFVALLPGSRRQEIRDNLPAMLEAAAACGGHTALVAGAPNIEEAFYRRCAGGRPFTLIFGETYAILRHSRAALVTSGTATLEAALLDVPQVVCYRTPIGAVVSFVFRHFFGVPYISLVNLIAGREVVRELFGATFSPPPLRTELLSLLDAPAGLCPASAPPAAGGLLDAPDVGDGSRRSATLPDASGTPLDTVTTLPYAAPRRSAVLAGYAEVRRRLGPAGAARRLAARLAAIH
jgi:lipid-A-disaccharide synthase